MASPGLPLASSPVMEHNIILYGSPSAAQSAPDSSRRHSLPTSFLAPNAASTNTVGTFGIAAGSEDAARGENTLSEALAAHRLSALRQLNGGRVRGHRYAKSTGARNSTFNQPVIVRTYSGANRPRSQRREPLGTRQENIMSKSKAKANAKLPPVEAFTFKGIMEEIKHDVSEDLERIAEICARSKYSLSNQYEVHMPPHGHSDPKLQAGMATSGRGAIFAGPTLQAIEIIDERPRASTRPLRGLRRTRSAAQGTLETIISSSRSSDEDQSKKKPAAEIVEEVRGRITRKSASDAGNLQKAAKSSRSQTEITRVRSKSITFASAFLENTTSSKHRSLSMTAPAPVGHPVRPQTSAGPVTAEIHTARIEASPRFSSRYSNIAGSTISQDVPSTRLPTVVESISSWLPWKMHAATDSLNAESRLKHLLNSSVSDKKSSVASG